MINHIRESVFRANTHFLVLLMAMLITSVTGTTRAKSLYVIADMRANPTILHAYDIAADGTLTFQTEFTAPHYILGAMGLAIDSHAKMLFVTYEEAELVQLVDATTMTSNGNARAQGSDNLAGIVYDHDKGSLYCVDRGTSKLYVYNWEASTAKLSSMPASPFTLTGASAFGIALDEINDLLYVANNSKTINVYHTSGWSLKETISVSHTAISIAVDATRGFVYTGGGFVGNQYLTQYSLDTRMESEVQVESDPDAGVMGLAVDPATGFVYVTTGRNNAPGGDNLRIYDTSLNQIDVIYDIGNPTGIAIPFGDISYNPLSLHKNIAGSNTNKFEQVEIGGTITYTICFDNKDNDYTINNVSIVDTLPKEVSFVTADGDGVFGLYDPVTHTYKWSYPSLEAGFPGDCLQLIAQVNQDTAPGTTITNSVTIDSDETGPTTTSVDAVTKAIVYNPLNISKDIIDGTIEQDVYKERCVSIGDTIIYGICFNNKDNDDTVTNVSIVDRLPDELSFVTAEGDGVFGQYNPITHTYTWTYPSLSPRSPGDCLQLIVQVNQDTAPSTTITNSVTIDSDETGPTTTSVDAVTKAIIYNPLNLSKDIVDGTIEQDLCKERCVSIGDTIIYGICFNNKDNDYTVTNVSIVDRLPDELSFVTAEGDGVFGQYNPITHTYTWTYPSLSPRSPGDCLQLIVQVNQDTAPSTTITNSVTIDSDETKPATVSVDVVTKAISYNPPNISKNIIGGTIEQIAIGELGCADVGDTIIYNICFDNKNNDSTITNVSVVDYLPYEVSFVTASGDGVFGYYDVFTHTYTWHYQSLSPIVPSTCLTLVVQVNQGAIQGTTITNSVTINSDETEATTASVAVASCTRPLEVCLTMYPNMIRRDGCLESISAIVKLPGISMNDIKDDLLILNPGYIKANRQIVFDNADGLEIHAWFDTAKLFAAVPGYGEVTVEVSGKLKSGQSFTGEDTIYITKFVGN